jgi:AcrR family transcriptional regulator
MPARVGERRSDARPRDARTRTSPPVARLAASQERRRRAIVDAAVQLAEKGGFEAVRLRDVADVSEVALGTLYKYFRSKEDILLFALAEEVEKLEVSIAARSFDGDSGLDRLTRFFQQATRGLVSRPHFARAVLRSLASGHSETTLKVASFHLRMTRLIVAALRGELPDLAADPAEPTGSERERQVAFILQNVWFSSLVGWAGGLHPVRTVAEHVRIAADLMLDR